MGVVYVAVGVTESVMARYRMDKVPKFVLTSFALAFFCNRHHPGVYQMIHPVDTILALVLLSVLFSFGSSRLPTLDQGVPFRAWSFPSCRFSWGTT
jgi:hypothetical protein